MIYVIRHAESAPLPDLDPADYPLTSSGHASAARLVPALSRLGITRIYSSPYQRALDTLAPFARSAGIDCDVDADLRERKVAASALPSPEAHVAAVRRCWEDFDHRFPGGESNRECQRRAVSAVARLHARHPGEPMAIGSHGQWTSLLLNALDAGFGVEQWLAMGNPALYAIDLDAGRWEKLATNIGSEGKR